MNFTADQKSQINEFDWKKNLKWWRQFISAPPVPYGFLCVSMLCEQSSVSPCCRLRALCSTCRSRASSCRSSTSEAMWHACVMFPVTGVCIYVGVFGGHGGVHICASVRRSWSWGCIWFFMCLEAMWTIERVTVLPPEVIVLDVPFARILSKLHE